MTRLQSRLLASAASVVLAGMPARAEQVLNVGVGGAFTSLDPHYHNLSPNNTVADHIFDALTAFDPEYNPAPALALSWKAVSDTVWEFKLRSDVKWHDGSSFTPEDIAFSFARIPTILNSPSSFNSSVKPVIRMEVVDLLTVRMHTAEPFPLLPQFLWNPRIVSHKAAEGASTADFNSGKATIGTGPFKLVSYSAGERVVLRRSEAWWGGDPGWDRVNYRILANGAGRTAALQAGDVDIIDQVGTRDVASLKANPKLDVSSSAGQRLIYIYMDSEREPTPFAFDLNGQKLARNPLKDARVRKALSLAINREGIRTQVMDGYSAPTGQLVPPGASGHDPEIKPDPYDPARARQLLAEAGWKDGFALTLHGPNDRYVNDAAIVQAVAQMWTRIGVKTAVQTAPASMFFSGAARDEYTVDLTGWSSDTGEASSSLVQIVASSNPAKGRGAVLRRSHYANAQIDAIVEQALATIDTPKREALHREATERAVADTAFLPIHHQVNIYAMRKGFTLLPRMQEGIRAWEVRGPK